MTNQVLELFATDWRDLWIHAEAGEAVGAIFTKPEIVDLILDLSGYSAEKIHLAAHTLLEPSCGDGAFLTAIVSRLLESERLHRKDIDWTNPLLKSAVRAADISLESVETARSAVIHLLTQSGCPTGAARKLADMWVVQTDFLLEDWHHKFDFVLGNPPYVRIEALPKRVLHRYRELFRTTSDRADLYVAFFERGLQLLSKGGTLGFISANRFTKNKYGEALRRLIADEFHVKHYINLEHTQPFLADVSAYPAIVVIDRSRGKATSAATLTDLDPKTLTEIRLDLRSRRPAKRLVSRFPKWYSNGEPWLTTSIAEHRLLDGLNSTLPLLEDSAPGTNVGIGVATGADNVYVLQGKDAEIEEARQIPLLMAADVSNAALSWSDHYLLNPFDDEDEGRLISLADYPGVAAHLAKHEAQLQLRHVAKNRPNTWFRTIDRIWPALTRREKLVIPDIQGTTTIGFDRGEFYPHHNLYWVASDTWPLLALKTLLRSSIVYRQVAAYSVQMRGGSVRFQAQTLRRLRIPALGSLSEQVLGRLIDLSSSEDQAAIDDTANEAFSISPGIGHSA